MESTLARSTEEKRNADSDGDLDLGRARDLCQKEEGLEALPPASTEEGLEGETNEKLEAGRPKPMWQCQNEEGLVALPQGEQKQKLEVVRPVTYIFKCSS